MILTERARIGSLDGEHDAFGLVSDAVITNTGLVVVADAMSGRLILFDQQGRYAGELGGIGDGPGEFRFPAVLAVDQWDSLLVWDSRHNRVSVFADERYVRSFPLPASWFVTSMLPQASGELLVAAMGPDTERPVHIVKRDGTLAGEIGPRVFEPLAAPFEKTLLGGYLTTVGGHVIYTNKSPYEIWIFDGRTLSLSKKCFGQEDWTTRPGNTVSRSLRSARLEWNTYVHSARVLPLSDSLFMNVIFDPVRDRRVLDVIAIDCRFIRRQIVDGHIMFTDSRAGRLAAVRRLEHAEVVLYDYRLIAH